MGKIGKRYLDHQTRKPQQGRKSGRGAVTTNTVEGYFSIFKRGMVVGCINTAVSGNTAQVCRGEFDFR